MARRRGLSGCLALLLLLRVFVPVGYMVAPGPQGGLALTICSGFGPPAPVSHRERPHGQPDGAGQQEPQHDPCPFALAGAAPLAGKASQPLVAAVAHAAPQSFVEIPLPARPLTGAHGARAPPFVS